MLQKRTTSAWARAASAAAALLMIGAVATGCSLHAGDGVAAVKTEAVSKQMLDSKMEVDADVIPSSTIPVVTKVGGDVSEVLVKRGDTVKEGDVLFRFDQKDALRNKEKQELAKKNLQAQLDKSAEDLATNKSVTRNSINKLKIQITDSQESLNKMKNDYDQGLVTQNQLDKAQRGFEALKLDLDTATKQLANMENTDPLAPLRLQIQTTDVAIQDIDKTLSDFDVKASTAGELTDFTPEVGMTLPAGTQVGQIQRLDPVKIHADLTESALKLVQGKKDVEFTLQGSSEKMSGTVTYLADVMSPQSKTYVLELSAPNASHQLKSGMRVKLQLGGDQKDNALVVPASALLKEGNDNYVFVLSGDLAEKRKVTLGRSTDTYREVVSGLKEGETLIVSGQYELKDQQKVTVAK